MSDEHQPIFQDLNEAFKYLLDWDFHLLGPVFFIWNSEILLVREAYSFSCQKS